MNVINCMGCICIHPLTLSCLDTCALNYTFFMLYLRLHASHKLQ